MVVQTPDQVGNNYYLNLQYVTSAGQRPAYLGSRSTNERILRSSSAMQPHYKCITSVKTGRSLIMAGTGYT